MNVKSAENVYPIKSEDTLKEILREIKKGQKRPDGIFGSFMTRPVSHIVAYLFKRIHFSPNMVSFISFVLCAYACLMLLMFQKNIWIFAASALVWWMGAILDAADGDLARYTKTGSDFGAWFDSYLDRFKEFLILLLILSVITKKS